MKCHGVRIDLRNPHLEVVVAASRDADGGILSAWPTSLVRSDRLLAAINATPFTPERFLPGRPVQPQGILMREGTVLSAAAGNFDALVESGSGEWSMQLGQPTPAGARLAVGGFVVNLLHGENRGERQTPDATTVVGLSADRAWMFWLVVDGGQPGYSEGATPRETADLLRELGAADALSLDGGSSSALVMAGGWRGARVVNRPRSPGVSGLQRPVACVLGVRVRP